MAKYLDQAGLQLVLSKLTNKYDGRYLGLHATADAAQKTVHKLTINVRDEESRVFDGTTDISFDVAQASHRHPASEVDYSNAGMSGVATVEEALNVLVKNVQIANGVISNATANMNTLKEALDQEVADRKQAITDEETARKAADSGLDTRIKALEDLLAGSGNVDEAIKGVIALLNAEVERSTAKDSEHDTAIANHKSRLETIEGDGEGSIKKAVKDEQDRAVAKENELSQAITTEKGRAEAAEKKLTDDLADEAEARANADTQLQTNIDTEKGRINILVADENTEGSVKKAVADAEARVKVTTDALDGRMTSAEGRLDVIQGTGEGSIKKAIADLVDGAPQDLDTLKELSAALRDNKDVLDAIEEAFDNKLEAETTERERVQGVHEQRMTDIETAAAQEVTDRKAAVKSEEDARVAADNALDARIKDIEDLVGDESMSLKDIREAIEANAQAIKTEESRAKGVEEDLQEAIDLINADKDTEGSFKYAIDQFAQQQDARDDAQDLRMDGIDTAIGVQGEGDAIGSGLHGRIDQETATRKSEDARLEGRIADIEELIGDGEGSTTLADLNERLQAVEAEQIVQNNSIAANAAAIAAIVALEEADIDAAFNAVFNA